jgi:Ig-like domain-containing protein
MGLPPSVLAPYPMGYNKKAMPRMDRHDNTARTDSGGTMTRRKLWLVLLAGLLGLALTLGACAPQATPTAVDEGPIRTSAVSTYQVELTATAQALAALITPTLIATPTSGTPEATETVGVTVTGTVSSGSCDNSQYVRDVTVPDNTVMQPGEHFTKTWRVKNTGTCAWTTAYSLVYGGYSDRLSGQTTALTADVAPGQEGDVSIDLVAPNNAGTYFSAWRLANSQDFPFGEFLYVQIIVR